MKAPTMNTCATCKHFIVPKDQYSRLESKAALPHVCGKIRAAVESDEDGSLPSAQTDKAYTEDGSGYYAAIRVREDFGCVLWEPKELTA